jgi:hypothetical protein
MAFPTVAINSTGSDTAASGAGPATAVTGTAAAHTGGAATTTITLTNSPNLTGVATDGSAAIWLATSSGRRWSKITAADNAAKTVTVEDTFTIASGSAVNYAIGGKRLSQDGSTQLGLDVKPGWTIDVQSALTNTVNFRLAFTAVNNLWVTYTSTTTPRPVITTATNSVYGLDVAGANNLIVSHLNFRSTAGTPGNGLSIASAVIANEVHVTDCVFDGFAVGIQDHDNGSNTSITGLVLTACEVKNCTGIGVNSWAGAQMEDCYVHGNAGKGLVVTSIGNKGISLFRCVFDSNAGNQGDLAPAAQVGHLISQCVFSNGIANNNLLNLNVTNATAFTIKNSIFYNQPGTGVALTAGGGSLAGIILKNNAFGANAAGNVSTATIPSTGTGAVTLTASPFVSSTDFALNSTAGGGAACKGAGFAHPASATATAPDIGAVTSGSATGGPKRRPKLNRLAA